MSGRYLLDTNILVYCFDASAPAKRKRANQLVKEGIERRSAIISYQVVQEFINVALKRFQPRLEIGDLRQYVSMVLRPMLAVNSSIALLQYGLEIVDRYRIGWYDSLIISAALHAQCEVLYTEDLQHLQRI